MGPKSNLWTLASGKHASGASDPNVSGRHLKALGGTRTGQGQRDVHLGVDMPGLDKKTLNKKSSPWIWANMC